MLVGVKNKKTSQKDEPTLKKIREAKSYFGIQHHHLEGLMGL